MKISDVMTKSPMSCEPDTRIEEIARQMLTCDCGSLPVVDGMRVIGMITDRDIVVRAIAAGKCPLELLAKDVMSHPAAVLLEDGSLQEAFKVLQENQVRRAPVVDSMNRLVGIVSQADLARAAATSETGELVQTISQGMSLGHD